MDDKRKLVIDDETLLHICDTERVASINYETDEELSDARERALQYSKGEMKDVPAMPRRSRAVSTDVADVIESALPMLMDILTGGEDPVTFMPTGDDDVEQAERETKYVRHVVFEQNEGEAAINDAVKDALEVKTAIIKYWWEDGEELEEEVFEDVPALTLQAVQEAGFEVDDVEVVPDEGLGELYSFTATRTQSAGCVKLMAVDPADFSVSADTTLSNFAEAPYVLHRIRCRAQDLLAQGFDEDAVHNLPAYSDYDDEEERARDTVDESDDGREANSHPTLRTVEVFEHWLRIDADGDGRPEIWKIVTDPDCTVMLSKERKNRIGFAVGTPFIRTHRFYGLSLADKLIEIQKIKTILLRTSLDGYYFGLNARYEVAEAGSSPNTITDLLRNEPGVPIRSQTGQAVRPINDRAPDVQTYDGLEYITVMGEQRTGIQRSTQGLKPDTLHDTATGALELMKNSQMRLRYMAKNFAKTLLRQLFLGVQGELAEHMTRTDRVRFHGDDKFTDIDPTQFGRRKDMSVQVAIGSGETRQRLQAVIALLEQQQQVAAVQGGIDGPLLGPENVHKALTSFLEISGMRSPSLYWKNPAEHAQQAQPEGPSPEEQEMQAKLQMQQQEAQAKLQMETQKAQMMAQIEQQKMQASQQLEREKAEFDAQLSREKAEAEFALAREKMRMEAELAALKVEHDPSGFRPGGQLDQ